LLARSFLDLLHAAELPECGPARLRRGHAGGDVSFYESVEMLLQFFGHFLVSTIVPEQAGESREPGAEFWHKQVF
jgi:hypothetical protein